MCLSDLEFPPRSERQSIVMLGVGVCVNSLKFIAIILWEVCGIFSGPWNQTA